MVKTIDQQGLRKIEDAVGRHGADGATASQIAAALDPAPPPRTLQYRLKHLVEQRRLIREGVRRGARYRLPRIAEAVGIAVGTSRAEAMGGGIVLPLSKQAAAIQDYVRRPSAARKPVGYDRTFLDSYRPNDSFYLTMHERTRLHEIGAPGIGEQPAGTFAKQILSRLLVDLAWNSSRLEGNTYSLLDTERLLELGEEAEGKQRVEAQMILNHKEAIEFLVEEAGQVGFDRRTILNLHGLLANNLLANPAATGRLRRIAVGIAGSVFHPLEVPQLIDECFRQLVAKAADIADPFEQALFVMVQLPYLQPFDDVNKRVSRLAANIPLIKRNLAPLSFEGVPRDSYTYAMLGVYELKRTEMLRDLFIWAYERSAARYAAVRQSLGEPDPFRLRHRTALRDIVGEVIRGRMNKKQASAYIVAWSQAHMDPEDREQFRVVAESELLGLHEGNFARYRVRPSEFDAWHEVWTL